MSKTAPLKCPAFTRYPSSTSQAASFSTRCALATHGHQPRLLHRQSTILMLLHLLIAGLPVDERLESQRHAPHGQHLVRLAAGPLAACCSIMCCCMLLASSQRRPSAQQHPCDKMMSSHNLHLPGTRCTRSRRSLHRHRVAMASTPCTRTPSRYTAFRSAAERQGVACVRTDKSAPHLLQEHAQQPHTVMACWGT
jgi:hypothetical protein